jgi:hypothetical protein
VTTPAWAAALVRGPKAAPHEGQARVPGDAERLAYREQVRLRTAALHARRTWPGAVGELVSRELLALAEFGCALDGDSLPARLVAQVLGPPP